VATAQADKGDVWTDNIDRLVRHKGYQPYKRHWYMTSASDKSKAHRRQLNNLRVQLALAAQKPAPVGPCPTDEALAALIDARLDETARADLLAHVDACETCYQTWLSLAQIKQEGPVAPIKKVRRLGAAGIALTAMAVFIFFLFQKPGLIGPDSARLVANGYRLIQEAEPGLSAQTLDAVMPSSWQSSAPAYGVGPAASNSPANLAFGAGLWSGKNRLAGYSDDEKSPEFLSSAPYADGKKNAWIRTAYRDYFLLGRWCVILKTACRMEADAVPDRFWTLQLKFITSMQRALEKESAKASSARLAVGGMERLKPHIEKKIADTSLGRPCRDISYEIDQLISQLSPAPEK
jgi:hypothetical protein